MLPLHSTTLQSIASSPFKPYRTVHCLSAHWRHSSPPHRLCLWIVPLLFLSAFPISLNGGKAFAGAFSHSLLCFQPFPSTAFIRLLINSNNFVDLCFSKPIHTTRHPQLNTQVTHPQHSQQKWGLVRWYLHRPATPSTLQRLSALGLSLAPPAGRKSLRVAVPDSPSGSHLRFVVCIIKICTTLHCC